MKVLFICALLVSEAFIIDGAHELCGMNNDQLKAILQCMGEHVDPKLKGKASEILRNQSDNLAEVVKMQCDAGVDFGEVMKTMFSDKEAEGIKKAYRECKPAEN